MTCSHFFLSVGCADSSPKGGSCRRFGDSLPTVVPAGWQALSCPPTGALPRNRLASSATGGASAILCPPSCQPVGRHCHARRPGHFLEIASLHPPQAALRRFSAHRRASRLAGIVMPADRGTSSKSPRFIRHRRRFGDSLPTVVPAGWQALSCPPTGALPRNRLASSATGGASAISPPFTPPSAPPGGGAWCGRRRSGAAWNRSG